MNIVLIGLIGYVLVQFAIGVWVSRRIASDKDYILAGRSLGPLLVTFSVFATWFGAEAMLATPAEIYKHGLAAAAVDPIGYGLALVLSGALLAARLWRQGITTFADAFRRRYSPAVEQLVVLILLPGSIFWAAAQILAFGHVLASAGSFDVTTAVTIAAVLVAAYAVVGGLLADAVTDLIQGLIVIVGLVVLGIAVAMAVGGPGAGLAAVAPGKLDILAAAGADPIERLERLAIPICGSLVAIELISRYLGARSAAVARGGTIAGGALYLLLGTIPVFLGLMATVLAASDPGFKARLGDAEQLVPEMAARFLPSWYYAIFAGAIVSAILSVVHAALHAPAAQISHNVLARLRPDLDARERLWSVRITVMLLSLVAFALAISYRGIKELVEIASAFGSAGVFVTAMFALFTPIGGPRSAIGAILTGTGVWALGKFALDWQAPYLAALAAATLVYLALAALDRALPRPEAAATPPPLAPPIAAAPADGGAMAILAALDKAGGRRSRRRRRK